MLCVGLNYRSHIHEMGRDLPRYPTLFAKFEDTLIGATDEISSRRRRMPSTGRSSWPSSSGRRSVGPPRNEAAAAIAGFTVLNDVTMRDWQFRLAVWLQGKTWESRRRSAPTWSRPTSCPAASGLPWRCASRRRDNVQKDDTGDLLFDPVELVEYVSTRSALNPGDMIATGTPGGVGHARKPPVYLTGGETVVTEIDGLGRLENLVVVDVR